MSSRYGRTFEQRSLGFGSTEAYPNKYLKPGLAPRRVGAAPREKRYAAFSTALLFPIFILLALSFTFRGEEYAVGFDWQLAMRVGGYCLAGISVLLAVGMRKFPIDRLVLAWALIPIFIIGSAVYALVRPLALTSGLAHLVLLLFAWRLVTELGRTPVALAIVISGLIIGVLSIVAYYVFPDIGRSTVEAYMSDPGGRMRGVTPQPNTLGALSAFTILLAVMFFQRFTARQRVLTAAAIAISAFCLVYSDSRTSIAALALCLLFWSLRQTNVALNLFTIVILALAACLVITFVPDVTTFLTRSDSVTNDLSSLNGRSWIWDVAWESIRAHRILGQGYGASRLILPMDDRLFGAAVNTHNLYLELLFSGGLVLFGIFACVAAATIFSAAKRGRTEALIALLFFLIRGGAEAAPFAGLPLFAAFAFYIAVALCLARSPSEAQMSPAMARRRPVFAGPRQRPAARNSA